MGSVRRAANAWILIGALVVTAAVGVGPASAAAAHPLPLGDENEGVEATGTSVTAGATDAYTVEHLVDNSLVRRSEVAVHDPARVEPAPASSVDTSQGATFFGSPEPGFSNRVTVAPPSGSRFEASTSVEVWSNPRTDTTGRLAMPSSCLISELSGLLHVVTAVYDAEGVLTSLTASFDVTCRLMPSYRWTGELRYASDEPYLAVSGHVSPTGTIAVPVGTPTGLTVDVGNQGTLAAALGTVSLTGPLAADLEIEANACEDLTLAPTETCELALTFTPRSSGQRTARVDIAIDGHPRGSATVFVVATGIPQPASPHGLRSFPTLGGVGVNWFGPITATSFDLFRRRDPAEDWEHLVMVPASSEIGLSGFAHVDPDIAPGESAEYQVTATGNGGVSPPTAPLMIVRPTVDPLVGDRTLVVFDGAPGLPYHPRIWDPAAGDTLEFTVHRNLRFSNDDRQSGSVSLPLETGSFAVVRFDPGPGEVALSMAMGGLACTHPSGTYEVHEAAFDAALEPQTFSADLEVSCGPGPPVHVSVRLNSTLGVRAAMAKPTLVNASVNVGESRETAVRVTNHGTEPVAIGDHRIVAGRASSDRADGGEIDWSVVADECRGVHLEPAASCEVTVRLAPTVRGTRTAELEVDDGTPFGRRIVRLRGVGVVLPGTPVDVRAIPAIGSVQLMWDGPEDTGETSLSGFRVHRSLNGGTFVDLGIVQSLTTTSTGSWIDRTVPVGANASYTIAAVNQAGEGTATGPVAAQTGRQQLLFSRDGIRAYPGLSHEYESVELTDLPDPMYRHRTPAVSPDGLRLAYARGTNNPGTHDLYVRRIFGTAGLTRLTSLEGDELDPAWSPDGTTIAFTLRAPDGTTSVWVVPASGGSPARRATNALDPAWLSDNRTLVAQRGEGTAARLVRISATGSISTIAGTSGAATPSVSPDGSRIAFSLRRDGHKHIGVGISPVSGGTAETRFAPNRDYDRLSWRSDGRALFATSLQKIGGHISAIVEEIPIATDGLIEAPRGVVGSARDPVHHVLGVRMVDRPVQTSGSPSLRFAVTHPTSATTTTCSLDGKKAVACTSPWTATGLPTGTHTLIVTSRSPSQIATVSAHTWQVDATPPTTKLTAPSGGATTATSMTVTYTGHDSGSGVRSYDVRYRRARYDGGFGAFVYPDSWQRTTATSRTLKLSAGWQYCVSVRARDHLGNRSAWSSERCVASPLDDQALSASNGWSRRTGTRYYRDTVTTSSRAGVTLSRSRVQARHLTLVATRCPTCGRVDVLFDGTRIATVDLKASTTQRQVLVAIPSFTAVRTGTVTLRTRDTDKTVQIDGIAFRRK